jgi:hypothetical protein
MPPRRYCKCPAENLNNPDQVVCGSSTAYQWWESQYQSALVAMANAQEPIVSIEAPTQNMNMWHSLNTTFTKKVYIKFFQFT